MRNPQKLTPRPPDLSPKVKGSYPRTEKRLFHFSEPAQALKPQSRSGGMRLQFWRQFSILETNVIKKEAPELILGPTTQQRLHSALTAVRSLPRAALRFTPDVEDAVAARLPATGQLHMRAVLRVLIRRWPEFSGDIVYPVPVPELGTPPWDVTLTSRLWDGRTKHGAARWRLLDYLIEQTEPKP